MNLSAHQFRSGELVEQVRRRAARRRASSRELLELEITESALMQDERARRRSARGAARATASRISIDDFGTGYSSLAYLRRLPVDALKIDRSFVQRHRRRTPTTPRSPPRSSSMARALRLRVVAEGVETEAQRALLAQLRLRRDPGLPDRAGAAAARRSKERAAREEA